MPPLPVVPDLNKLDELATRFRASGEWAISEELLRECAEETLDDRIVPAIAYTRLMLVLHPALAKSC